MHRDNLAFAISTEYFVRLSTFADGELSFIFQWLLCMPTCTQLKILHSTHTEYLCDFFGSQYKQEVFPLAFTTHAA